MKKAKLMLSAIAVVTVVSSAFAFKARTFDNHVIFTGALGKGVCQTRTTAAEIATGTANVAASTTSLATTCPDAFTQAVID
jgi:hypothetical protein